jgi:hypothetical protein
MRAVTCLLLTFACRAGPGEHIATWPTPPSAMAADASGIYAQAIDRLMHVPLSGGTPRSFSAGSYGAHPPQLTADAVIWAYIFPGGQGAVESMAKPDGAPVAIATFDGAAGREEYGLTRDATSLYWIVQDFSKAPRRTTILTTPIAGGAVKTLLDTTDVSVSSVAADDTRIYYNEMAVDPGQDAHCCALRAMLKDGSGSTAIWNGVGGGLFVAGRSLFWSSGNDVWKMDLDSGAIALHWKSIDGRVVAADDRGVVAFNMQCEGGGEDEPPPCSSRLTEYPAGRVIAEADGVAYAFCMFGDFVYWTPGGTDLRRVRR